MMMGVPYYSVICLIEHTQFIQRSCIFVLVCVNKYKVC